MSIPATDEVALKIEALPPTGVVPRPRVTRRRVLETAVDLADREGIEALSMRRLGQELGIEAMSLYTHVRSKDDLLAGMVEVVITQIPRRKGRRGWQRTLRGIVLDARGVMLRHPWAPAIIESMDDPGPAGLRHFDTVIGILREGGLSLELTHHALHLMGSRILGFTQDLFDDSSDVDPKVAALLAEQIGATHPYVAELAVAVTHDGGLGGCDTDAEFEFALDVILDSLERLRDADYRSGSV